MEKQLFEHWKAISEPNDDRPGVNVYLEHSSGASCSLRWAEDMGETNDGERRVPQKVINAAYKWIEEENLDY